MILSKEAGTRQSDECGIGIPTKVPPTRRTLKRCLVNCADMTVSLTVNVRALHGCGLPR